MLELQSIEKKFGSKQVLRGVTLSVPRGHCLCLAGANAEGKTTLLSIAAGLLAPDHGAVFTDGAVGFVAQDAAALDELTLSDNLRLWYAARDLPTVLFAADSPETILGLFPHRKTRAGALSGGVRRRLSIATALIGHPAYVLLDEPFASLDTAACEELASMLCALKENGVGILLTSHDPARLAAVADEAIVLRGGLVSGHASLLGQTPEQKAAQILALLLVNHGSYSRPQPNLEDER